MADELEQVLDEVEPRRSVAAVAPVAFFLGTAMGAILAGFLVFYAMVTVPRPGAFSGDVTRFWTGEPAQEPDMRRVLTDLSAAVDRLNGRLRADPGSVEDPVEEQDPVADTPEGPPPTEGTEGGEASSPTPAPDANPSGGPPATRALLRDMDELRAKLRAAEKALQEARADRRELEKEIDVLRRDLEITERLLDAASDDAVYNRWLAFLEGAKASICKASSKTRRASCQDLVSRALLTPTRREQYEFCLRSGQDEPQLVELEPGEFPPDHGYMVNEENRLTRGWMVLFCDPTLPVDQDRRVAAPAAITEGAQARR